VGRLLVPLALFAVLAVLYYARRDPTGAARLWNRLRPLAPLVLALVYLASPIDLIPDQSLIGIADDIAVLLAALYFGRRVPGAGEEAKRRGAEQKARQRPSGAGDFDPFAVLGVGRGASQEEIVKAFREKMKQYHPDRVADLGEELQKLAHEKAVEIRRAYDSLKKG
jgi:uncharacterized membrane protein YkvA (DUF1232 family)